MAVYEISETVSKALAKGAANAVNPTAKVRSELAFFRFVLATIGIDFDALTPAETVSWQTDLFTAWQGSDERRAELEAEKAERDAEAARDRLAKLETEAAKKADAKSRKLAELRKIEDDERELAALREKFANLSE